MSDKTLAEEVEDQKRRGVLLVLTGPTGSGKDTILNQLKQTNPSMVKIITTTTRQMRVGESEGNPYYFLSRDDFAKKIEERTFFEWEEIRGELYGTQKKTLTDALASGQDVIWRIDTRGVKNTKEKLKNLVDRVVFVFLTAPEAVLLERVKRDEGEKYQHRWNESLVKWEIEQFDDCDYLVYNREGELKKTIDNVFAIMQAKRLELHKSSARLDSR